MRLNNIARPAGARTRKKDIGRGPGSGHGKTSGRGSKGATSRSGSGVNPGFEGGQMPLIRRIPKRGFTNEFKQIFQVVNVESLNTFDDNAKVTIEELFKRNLVKKQRVPIKVLGNGDLKKKLTVCAAKFSRQAVAKIEQAGGKAELINA